MTQNPQVRLSVSGLIASVEPDRFVDGGMQLVVDGTPQSHVNTAEPRELFFEYIQRMGHVIDEIGREGEPITAVHLGAGALTLPRYIEATRPGSRQQVVELERELVDLVRETIPWDRRANIRVRYGDAREVLDRLPAGLHGSADLVVVDIFSGARTPAHVTSTEFYALAARLLAPEGIIVVNVADGAGLRFARGQAATLRGVVSEVAALAETQVLKGRRFGNVVLIGSNAPLPLDYIPRLLASGPHPAKAVSGEEMDDFIGRALPVSDETAIPSPPPGRNVFQVRG
ncbi:spermidine synthase [Mycetocola reblochoni]|uniref:Spermidine synthase n=2 Tax=Mycetocola reblochoni TaxID=331618 RepID=A0A1R4ID96_9MICO|nr:fused MFS/spermidine synthase [Mycetocola reblochoni]RLP69106.1 spermine synthase [Mycetocola reblochoni]SJN17706.1 Spermidine synthase [Mycetocola reblochoni REB411]